tara:strand:+ start:154 stop:726 length:573 start_codon:yes stop_codon:yes gene_type:complete
MEGFYIKNDDHIYLSGLYHEYDYDSDYDSDCDYKKKCFVSFEVPYEDKESKDKFITEFYENSTRFIVWKRRYSNKFIKNIKLLLKKYNIDDCYDMIINIINNDYNFNFNYDIYDYKLHRIVDTCTCWSDDRNIYEIEDDKIKKMIISNHGFNKCYIECKNNIISNIEYIGKYFSVDYKLRDKIPSIEDIL